MDRRDVGWDIWFFSFCGGVSKLFPNTSTDFIPFTSFHCRTVDHINISHWENLFNACYLLMKSQIQAPNWRRWSWYLRGSKLLRHLPRFCCSLLNLLLSDAVISLFTCFFSLKCYVGTVHVLYDSIFNNVLGNLALRIFVFF